VSDADYSGDGKLLGGYELFKVFLLVGCQAFGGYMAIVAMIERYLVRDRKAVSRDDLLDAVSIGNLLPGPLAVNIASLIGYRYLGIRGFAAAWSGLLFPSFVSCVGLKLLFDRAGDAPLFQAVSSGLLIGVLAVVSSSVFDMSKSTLKDRPQLLAWLGSLSFFVWDPFGNRFLTLGCLYLAPVGWAFFRRRSSVGGLVKVELGLLSRLSAGVGALLGVVFALLGQDWSGLGYRMDLLISFGLASLALFGGAYSFIPIVGELAVSQRGWISMDTFLEAVAIGQLSPGPVLVSSSCIGFEVAGLGGAAIATFAIFFPPAALTAYVGGKLFDLGRNGFVGEILGCLKPVVLGVLCGSVLYAIWASLGGESVGRGMLGALVLAAGIGLLAGRKGSSLVVLIGSGGIYGLLAAFSLL